MRERGRNQGAAHPLLALMGQDEAGLTLGEAIAVAASLLWILAMGAVLVFGGGSANTATLNGIVGFLVLVLPVTMIWGAVAALRAARILREESRRLRAAVDAMRQSLTADRQSRGAQPLAAPMPVPAMVIAPEPDPEPYREPEPEPAPEPPPPAASPVAPRASEPAEEQPSLALESQAEAAPPLEIAPFILALNFPENDQDHVGFEALRLALKDRRARQLIQAAQDVLTLLSRDGIYMDDLDPDRARPEIWRRFAAGERGRAVAALGGVRDRSALALTMGRMREDTIFRDTSHHFLRLFDRMLQDFEPAASDEEIAALAETRTARAFMILGRASGAFD